MADNPDLRREFVGIMFALAVGEVGLQAASLIQAGHPIHYLPAYSHLFLALFVIAASWVGWSRTQVPGAKEDVNDLFEWPFVVLLLDTAMVVTYFILVRTVDFSDGNHRIDPSAEVAFWHVFIFGLYVAWDVVTKVVMYKRPDGTSWLNGWSGNKDSQLRLLRVFPTLVCLGASFWLWRVLAGAHDEYLLTADLALLSMVLLFRALKGLATGIWQTAEDIEKKKPRRIVSRVVWSVILLVGLLYGSFATSNSWRVPLRWWIITEIRTQVVKNRDTETPPALTGGPAVAQIRGLDSAAN